MDTIERLSTCECEAEGIRQELASERYEDWLDEVSYLYGNGVISLSTLKVAYSIAPHFAWLTPGEHGARQVGTKDEIAERISVSRTSMYRARAELIGSGLIIKDRGIWYAAVSDGDHR